MGNRIGKSFTENSQTIYTWYVRDAQGNTMATYEQKTVESEQELCLIELPIYGSSRLGMLQPNKLLNNTATVTNTFAIGRKQYEISNHLGNVLTTISDSKQAIDDGQGQVAYYKPIVKTQQDYYPFGMLMPERQFTLGNEDYRYGFNGKEKDDEVKGSGNSCDFGARIYDSRLGRWLSLDPLQAKYPDLTPYNFVGNNPMIFIDPNGKEIVITFGNNQKYIYGSKDPIPDDEFVQQSIIALNDIINNSENTFNPIQVISDSKNFKWYIGEGNVSESNDVYTIAIPETNKAYTQWDPTAGIFSESGGRQSPSTQLLHEGGHAYLGLLMSNIYLSYQKMLKTEKTEKGQDVIQKQAKSELSSIRFTSFIAHPSWDELEEKYVNDIIVNPYAKIKGQGLRYSHGGEFIKTIGPISTELSGPEMMPESRGPIAN